APLRSALRPPKLAPSTWQLYFTDWIQRHQLLHGADKKLNVAQAAKEAGAEYAGLSPEQKEPYKRRSQAMKEAREREVAAWQRTLTPEDIKRENQFRAAQRKAGKSRRGNIKDPNAPKKPLSAYFMFLHHIRADRALVREVFGEERETTAQSVLAAAKWRSMTDEERKPFLAQAEKEKLDYEAARRLYEEGTVGFETTISFGTAPAPALPFGHGAFALAPGPAPELSSDSEPDSEGCTTDEGAAAAAAARRRPGRPVWA
ncbi:high mobility group box domain-containing protein, partial [Phellopilus nigrolimitatus]